VNRCVALYLNRRLWPFTALNSWTGSLSTGFKSRLELALQFIHVRSRHPNALPLIITHGWPGSILELVKVIGPLTDPTTYGGGAEDACDVVIPSMPGYGIPIPYRDRARPPVSRWEIQAAERASGPLTSPTRIRFQAHVLSPHGHGVSHSSC
jgi:pimeloyl-ACP methyl ester carboxylesterase